MAREFEPSEQTIRNWVKQADLDEGLRSDGLTTEAREEMQRLKRDVKRLRMERDILKKSRGLVREGERIDPRRGYAFMKANRARFPLAIMCRVLGLSSSGYHDWLHRGPSARARRDAELKGEILAKWIESGGIYGCPRIHAALLAGGERVGRKRVARLMRELGIEGRDAQALQDGHDEAGCRRQGRAGPGEPGLLGRRSRPAVGGRHHAGADPGGMAVPRRGARCVEPADRRLGDGAPDAGRAGGRRAEDGDLDPPAEGTGDPSFRSRLAG